MSEKESATAEGLIIVAQLGAPFGIQGWQHVRSFTQPWENVLNYPNWRVMQKQAWTPMQVAEGKKQGQGLVVRLEGIQTPEQAALFSNCSVAVCRSILPPLEPEQFYWTDLEGLAVEDKAGNLLGNIQYLYRNAQLDVMVVKQAEREQHIPFLMHDTVVKVEIEKKRLIVDWDIAE